MKIIHKAKVLHEEWEMDNDMNISKDSEGNLHAFTTNHGRKCKMSVEELCSKIKETESSLTGLKKALGLLMCGGEK